MPKRTITLSHSVLFGLYTKLFLESGLYDAMFKKIPRTHPNEEGHGLSTA